MLLCILHRLRLVLERHVLQINYGRALQMLNPIHPQGVESSESLSLSKYGKLDLDVDVQVLKCIATGYIKARCAIFGRETADLSGLLI